MNQIKKQLTTASYLEIQIFNSWTAETNTVCFEVKSMAISQQANYTD
jgi:hypothetical protein